MPFQDPTRKLPPHGELIRAVINGDLERVKSLLDQGADIEEKDGAGDTPLNEAARTNHPEILKFLIDRGANIDAPNKQGKNALAWARNNSHQDIMRILQDKFEEEQLKESWEIIGPDKVAHIGVYPRIQKRLTDIFDFAARERLTISDDLRTKASAMPPILSFDKLPEETIKKALSEFKKLGGKTDEEHALHGAHPAKKISPHKIKP